MKAPHKKGVFEMANIAYVRVSSADQNEARQSDLEKYKIDKWFIDKLSGKDTNRPALQSMLDYIREGDTVYVHEFARLGRNTMDLLNIINTLEEKKVKFISNKENLDTSTQSGRLMLTMLAAIAEFERAMILERQREGIKIQKELDKKRKPEDKKYKGRKAITIDNRFKAAYERYMKREISKKEFAECLDISRPTLDKLIKEYTAV